VTRFPGGGAEVAETSLITGRWKRKIEIGKASWIAKYTTSLWYNNCIIRLLKGRRYAIEGKVRIIYEL